NMQADRSTLHGRVQWNRHLGLGGLWRWPGACAATSTCPLLAKEIFHVRGPASSEELTEEVGGLGWVDVLERGSARSAGAPVKGLAAGSTAHLRTFEAESVVLGTLILVAEHVVGGLDFFESFFRLLVPGIPVRMMLAGQFAVCLLDLVLGGTLLDTEYFVVI